MTKITQQSNECLPPPLSGPPAGPLRLCSSCLSFSFSPAPTTAKPLKQQQNLETAFKYKAYRRDSEVSGQGRACGTTRKRWSGRQMPLVCLSFSAILSTSVVPLSWGLAWGSPQAHSPPWPALSEAPRFPLFSPPPSPLCVNSGSLGAPCPHGVALGKSSALCKWG